MKTSELKGSALDWSVAKCEGIINGGDLDIGFILEGGYTPSTDWAQGGPIIEREKITIVVFDQHDYWNAHQTGYPFIEYAPTPLIAAMRCYVESKLGDDVDIPTELQEFTEEGARA